MQRRIPVNLELDDKDQERIETLARESGMDPAELARELLHRALEDRECSGPQAMDAQEATIRRQQEELERLYTDLAPLPVSVKDGFSGRDHDRILQGTAPHQEGVRV
jgi:hypothetical protein